MEKSQQMEAKRKILVVDDHSGVRRMTATALESEGYVVIEAATPAQALNIASSNPIDAFLLDIKLEGASGIDICRTLRTFEQYKTTPILFLTGADLDRGIAAAYAAGCDDFISKPMDIAVLRARLKSHLQRADLFDRLQRTRRMLNRYVSRRTREIVEAATETGQIPPPAERTVVILFTDIRRFTALSEEIPADLLFNLLSAQLAKQVDSIYSHGGYVDKFGGDGVMAVFDGENMIRQACLCALDIIEKTRNDSTINEKIRRIGIGIHTGRVVIGNIGSPEHLDYSVIGTAVNLAARLCGYAESMSIVVSQEVRDAASGDASFTFYSERQATVRGLKTPVTIYSLSKNTTPP